DLPQGVGPGLAGTPAAAGRVEFLAIAERIGEAGVGLAGERHRLRHVLAGIAVGVERHLGGGTHALAGLLGVAALALRRRIRKRALESMAGSHGDGAESRRLIARRQAAGAERRCNRAAAAPTASAAEQRLEESPLAGRRRGRAILRAAVVLAKRRQELPALPVGGARPALQLPQVGIEPVEVAAHPPDAVVEVVALRRLAAAEQEESGPLAPGTPGLLGGAVDLRLL